ncbi:L-cystine-binding protein tcyA [Aphis craccivora]|uniref:L-cystine-binding protein tcyA n=1 Tax=Aphis craccivora TaxID=307492 RepID=A0A6G0W0K4_APHCR|nr:L-cystine-binding protein tcyA [Aphis craccivora]
MSGNKNVMKMNDEQTMNFINYYEKEEVLWNTKLQAYRNRDARVEAVKRVVSAMNIEGFGPNHVISKFKNLRSSYCQELKKIATSEKSGASVEDIYVPHVIWFSKMDLF